MPVLADCLVARQLVEAVSDATVRRVLKKTPASRGNAKNGAFPASVLTVSGIGRMCWRCMLSRMMYGVRTSVVMKVLCH